MKKKLLALLLAATLTTGVGGFGTYAYFTDTDKLSTDVSIVMGDLSVKSYWSTDDGAGRGTWAQVRKNVDAREAKDKGQAKGNDFKFTDVKPGDKFQREFNVINDGTLIASNVKVFVNENIPKGCKVTIAPKEGQTGQDVVIKSEKECLVNRLKVGNSYECYRVFTVTVEVPQGEKPDNTLNQLNIENVLDKGVQDLVTIEAEQLKD